MSVWDANEIIDRFMTVRPPWTRRCHIVPRPLLKTEREHLGQGRVAPGEQSPGATRPKGPTPQGPAAVRLLVQYIKGGGLQLRPVGSRQSPRSIKPQVICLSDRPRGGCRGGRRGSRAGYIGSSRGCGARFRNRGAGRSYRLTQRSILVTQTPGTSRDEQQGRRNRRQAGCRFHQPTAP